MTLLVRLSTPLALSNSSICPIDADVGQPSRFDPDLSAFLDPA